VYNTTLKQSDSKWIFIKVKHEKDHSKVAQNSEDCIVSWR
jgi:hypothetical protein